MVSAIGRIKHSSYTPINCTCGRVGFSSGPSTLKIVRVLRAWRTGIAWRIPAWYCGANKKQIPNSSRQAFACSGVWVKLMPNASNKSEEPDLLDTLRLPCFVIFNPQAAATNAAVVEMLMVFMLSPPVPQQSACSSSIAGKGVAAANNACAAPAISSGCSPRIFNAVTTDESTIGSISPRTTAVNTVLILQASVLGLRITFLE